jgi:hypothetical protein
LGVRRTSADRKKSINRYALLYFVLESAHAFLKYFTEIA